MESQEFKARYLAQVRRTCVDAPPELLADLLQFVSFDRVVLERYGLGTEEVRFLTSAGLPREAAPFLGFDAYSEAELENLYESSFAPRDLFPLGSNGSGDPLGIELPSGAVVYLNHDDGMGRVFVNSSLSQFAESLVLYQELRHSRELHALLERIAAIDPPAISDGSMWRIEADSGVDDDA
jgi:hypothetical protein